MSLSYILGVLVQALGWAVVFVGLWISWVGNFQATPFIYLGY